MGGGGGGGGGGGLQDFSVSPSPLWLDLFGTLLGLGQGGFGTKGLGTGLYNIHGLFNWLYLEL